MKKINFKKILGQPIVKGIFKELVSYVPVIGDTLSNKIENTVGTGVNKVDPKAQQYQEIAGKIIIGGLVVSFVAGWITLDDVKALIKLVY